MTTPLEQLTKRIGRLATHYDFNAEWPQQSIDCLGEVDAWRWAIPEEYGGIGLDPASLLLAYEAVAAGCMSTLLILTQRDGACELLVSSDNDDLKSDLLPKLASNELFTSVGLSQLTTSRQTGKPALIAEPAGRNFVLRGFMPWVTSAEKCDFVVSGAALPDGRQILVAIPMDAKGIQIDPAMNLMALEGTLTAEVHCRNVVITPDQVVQGPQEHVLRRRSTVKVLVVAASGMGLARAMALYIAKQSLKAAAELREPAEELVHRYDAVRGRFKRILEKLSQSGGEPQKPNLRVTVNDLLMRLAVATLIFGKGSGFQRQRDAQRMVREAMFFMVWSAPDEVRANTLSAFLRADLPVSRSKSMGV